MHIHCFSPGFDSRRQHGVALRLAIALALALAARAEGAPTNPVLPGSITIGLTRVTTLPTADNGADNVTFAPGDPSRLFITGRKGQIRIFAGGALQPTPFLDLAGAGLSIVNNGGSDERGLLGLAFHPGYNDSASSGYRKFYTYTSETLSGNADFSHPEIGLAAGNHQSLIREWTASSGNPDLANTTSRILMRIAEPQANHNGGGMVFGKDNMLYIALGDGGGANDASGGFNNATDGHTNNTGNGQDTTNVYGKILRVDPLGNNSANGQYGIPASNPFASSSTNVKEIYAYGLRNAFRFSVDRLTGTIYAGDVGQGQREEIDVIVNGANYGWPYREGTLDNSVFAAVVPGGFTSTDPIGEYTHGDGLAIIGGFVYRGTAIPTLTGKYVFGDYKAPGATGTPRLFFMDAAGGPVSEFLYDAYAVPFTTTSTLFSIGEGPSGELYATFSNGDVLAIVPEPAGMLLLAPLAGAILLARRRPGR